MTNFPKPIVAPIQMSPPKPMTMGELYDIASHYGEVSVGGIMSPVQVEIKLNFTGGDSVWVKCRESTNVLQNFGEAIRRAEQLKQFYKGLD